MIFYRQPTDPWVPFDFKLLETYQIMQDEICPKCGHPVWLCRTSSADVEFIVRTDMCYAERALKEHDEQKKPVKDRTKAKDRKGWGRIEYTVAQVPKPLEEAGHKLPSRTTYYNELAGQKA